MNVWSATGLSLLQMPAPSETPVPSEGAEVQLLLQTRRYWFRHLAIPMEIHGHVCDAQDIWLSWLRSADLHRLSKISTAGQDRLLCFRSVCRKLTIQARGAAGGEEVTDLHMSYLLISPDIAFIMSMHVDVSCSGSCTSSSNFHPTCRSTEQRR